MHIRLVVPLLATLGALTPAARAQSPTGSGITYQGELRRLGEPVNDTADFQFALWDAESGGNMVGVMLAASGVALAGGRFTVALDFGLPSFNGDARWLEVAVRSPSGSGPFTTLGDRQPLTASPYSLQTRGIRFDETGNATVGGTVTAAGFVGPLEAVNLTGTVPESVLPQNQIDGSEIENNSLTGADIQNDSIGTYQVSGLQGADIIANTLTGDHIRGVYNAGNGSKPFHFQRYGPFGSSGVVNTGFPTDSFIAAVVGFRTFSGDIQENGVGDPVYCYPYQNNGAWHLTFDFRSHNTNEGWEVWVMFVDRRMATIAGF